MQTECVSPYLLAGAVYDSLGCTYPHTVRARLGDLSYPYGKEVTAQAQQQFAVRVLNEYLETKSLHRAEYLSDEALLLATMATLGFETPVHLGAERYLGVIGGFFYEQLRGFDPTFRSQLPPNSIR